MNQEGAEQKDTPPARGVAVPDRRSWERARLVATRGRERIRRVMTLCYRLLRREKREFCWVVGATLNFLQKNTERR